MRTTVQNRGADVQQPPAGDAAGPSPPPTATYPHWEAIYTDNVGRIYRLMFSKVGNRPDAEDLTSQVFLAALGPLHSSSSVGEVRAYLFATARTVLAAHWRRTLGHRVTEIDLDHTDPADLTAPDDPQTSRDHEERTARILAGLPERHRRILTLRFLQGYSIREAAAELGVSVANAKVLQHRALRQAACLDEKGEAS